MGLLRKLMFVASLILIAIPLFSWFSIFSLTPQGSFFGFDYNIWSIAIGIILLIFAFLSWRSAKIRMDAYQAMQKIPEKQRLAMGYVGQWPAYKS